MAETLQIVINAKDNASGPIKGVNKSLGGLGKAAGTAAKVAAVGFAAAGIAAIAFGAKAVSMGSDVEEMMGKFNVVFGKETDRVIRSLDALGAAVGRSKYELREMASGVQDMFVPMGFARDAAADMSVALTELAVDVGSFNNVADTEVMDRFQSALVGNHEAVRSFGIIITEATLKEELARMGMEDLTGAALAQAKVQARLNLIYAGTSDAHGDAERTAGSWANTMRGLKATLSDTASEIGLKLLPVLTPLLQGMADMAVKYAPMAIAAFEGMITTITNLFAVLQGTTVTDIFAMIGLSPEKMAMVQAAWARLVAFFEPTIQRLIAAWPQMTASMEPLAGKFQALWIAVQPIVELLGVVLIAAINLLMEVWAAVMPQLGSIFGGVIDAITAQITMLVDIFSGMIELISAIIAGDWTAAWEAARGIGEAFVVGMSAIFGGLQTALGGIFTAITTAVSNWVSNLAEQSPAVAAAVETMSAVWNDTLLPAIEAVSSFFTDTVFPTFDALVDWFTGAGTTAVDDTASLWTDTLKPAFEVVWEFLNTYIIPIFEVLYSISMELMRIALEALTLVWNEVFLPALDAIWLFIKDNLIPIFDAVVTILNVALTIAFNSVKKLISDKVVPVFDTLKGMIDSVKGAFSALGGAISSVIGWLQKVKDKLASISIPAWIHQGSPSPIEQAFLDLGGVIKIIATKWLPLFSEKLGSVNTRALTGILGTISAAIKLMKEMGSVETGFQPINLTGILDYLRPQLLEIVEFMNGIWEDIEDIAKDASSAAAAVSKIMAPFNTLIRGMEALYKAEQGTLDGILTHTKPRLIEVFKFLADVWEEVSDIAADSESAATAAGKITAPLRNIVTGMKALYDADQGTLDGVLAHTMPRLERVFIDLADLWEKVRDIAANSEAAATAAGKVTVPLRNLIDGMAALYNADQGTLDGILAHTMPRLERVFIDLADLWIKIENIAIGSGAAADAVGKVVAPLKALMDGMAALYGAEQGTLDGILAHTMPRLERVFIDLADLWPKIEHLAQSATASASAISAISSGVGSAIKMMTELFDSKVIGDIRDAWDSFTRALIYIMNDFERVRKRITLVADDDLKKLTGAISDIAGGLSSAVDLLAKTPTGLVMPTNQWWASFREFILRMLKEFETIAKMPIAVSPEYIEKLKAVFSGLNEALGVLASLADDGVRKFLEGHAILGSDFQRAVANLIESISLTLEAFQIWVHTRVDKEWLLVAEEFATSISTIFNVLRDALSLFIDLEAGGIPGTDKIQAFLDAVLTVIQQYTEALRNTVGQLQPITDDLAKELNEIPGLSGGIGGMLPAGANITYTKRIIVEAKIEGDLTSSVYDQLKNDLLWAVRNNG